jgi:helicase-like protein/RecQ helicase-like protein
VITAETEEEKLRLLFKKMLRRLPRPGIVYSATVKSVEDLGFLMKRLRLPGEYYHGRMKKADREEAQKRFMKQGRRVVMAATNAFGLGVDKPDIRYVIHFHVPGSLEAYVQEAGRAGRDGKLARCILLWSPDDVAIQEYFQEGNYPSPKQVRQVAEALAAWTGTDREVGIRALAESSNVGEKRTRVVLDFLAENGWAEETDDGKWLARGEVSENYLKQAAQWFDLKRIEDRRRLDALVDYAKSTQCRVRHMLDYFGEPGPEHCGRCDNCRAAGFGVETAPVVTVDGAPEEEGGRRKRGRRRRGRGRGRREGEPRVATQATERQPAAEGATAAAGGPPSEAGVAPGPRVAGVPAGEPGAGPGRRRRRRRRRGRGRDQGAPGPVPGAVGAGPVEAMPGPSEIPGASLAPASSSEAGAAASTRAASGSPAAGPIPAGEAQGRRRKRRRRRGRGRGPQGGPPAEGSPPAGGSPAGQPPPAA